MNFIRRQAIRDSFSTEDGMETLSQALLLLNLSGTPLLKMAVKLLIKETCVGTDFCYVEGREYHVPSILAASLLKEKLAELIDDPKVSKPKRTLGNG